VDYTHVQLPEGFQHHIFISYGWSGNLRPDEGDRGWAAELRNRLILALRTEFGSSPEIFSGHGNVSVRRTEAVARKGARIHGASSLCRIARLLPVAVAPLGGATLPRYRLVTGLAQQHAPSRRPYRRRDASGGIAPATASGFAIPRSAGIRSSPCDAGLGVQRPVVWEEIEQQCPARDEFPALVSELAQRLKALQTIEQARVKPSGLSIFIAERRPRATTKNSSWC